MFPEVEEERDVLDGLVEEDEDVGVGGCGGVQEEGVEGWC